MQIAADSPVTYAVASIPVAAITPVDAAQLIVNRAAAGGSYAVHLCNAYTVSLVDTDVRLRAALLTADLNLPDGTPVAWIGRRAGVHGPVRGPRLLVDVARQGVQTGLRHYLYGGAPGVAELVSRRLGDVAPGVEVVGCECPPYDDLDDMELDALAARIAGTGAQVVWVGLGTPRQDYLVGRLAARVGRTVVPVGAAFDFLSGRVPEAPAWLHGTGFEWVHRLASEPGRLWRRYLLGNARFVKVVWRSRRNVPPA